MRMELFDQSVPAKPLQPLADRMRPDRLEKFVGQDELVGEGTALRERIVGGTLMAAIFWGPPGSGKSTLARIVARIGDFHLIERSAVQSGVKDIRSAVDKAGEKWRLSGKKTILFIDEIHRFGKVQQDAILPHLESGAIGLLGATTENPALAVIPALRSRLGIYRLKRLKREEIRTIIDRALNEGGFDPLFGELLNDTIKERIADKSAGDGRIALNLVQALSNVCNTRSMIDVDLVDELTRDSTILYDKSSQEHYDHASAFQKSLRGSDPDAAIYWLAKMLAGGEDPMFIARRLVVTASEDVGLADPAALLVATSVMNVVEKIGMPECGISLAQATIHIATAPKSNSAYQAIKSALYDVTGNGKSYPVPNHLREKVNKNRSEEGRYLYPHDYPGHEVTQQYLPTELEGVEYYKPLNQGRESAILQSKNRRK